MAQPVLALAPGALETTRPSWLSRASFPFESRFVPGLGLSKTPLVRGDGFARMADALQAFVRELALDDFTLIVHATGGPSGLEMAIRERARVRGLVISNTFAWPLRDDPGLRKMVGIVSTPELGRAALRESPEQ
jgi:pimeloyl-ACP methyl ester carboxylesterase